MSSVGDYIIREVVRVDAEELGRVLVAAAQSHGGFIALKRLGFRSVVIRSRARLT